MATQAWPRHPSPKNVPVPLVEGDSPLPADKPAGLVLQGGKRVGCKSICFVFRSLGALVPRRSRSWRCVARPNPPCGLSMPTRRPQRLGLIFLGTWRWASVSAPRPTRPDDQYRGGRGPYVAAALGNGRRGISWVSSGISHPRKGHAKPVLPGRRRWSRSGRYDEATASLSPVLASRSQRTVCTLGDCFASARRPT